MKQGLLRLCLLSLAVCSFTTWAQQQPTVIVRANQQNRPDGTATYGYSVTNNGGVAIVAIAIGSDYYHGISELDVYPLGWSVDVGIPQGSVSSPAHWTPTVVTTEESKLVEIEWSTDATAAIAPGQTESGFEIVTPHSTSEYLSSHWTAFFTDGTAASGLITLATAPRISVKIGTQTLGTSNQWQVSLNVANTGSDSASGITLSEIALRTIVGDGSASIVSPAAPVNVGNLSAGEQTSVPLVISVPASVKKLSITETGTLQASDGSHPSFSSAQVMYPKGH